jgi:5S rRNA maturation endonuclease (ribonuclease M5)/archaellum component FlaC
LSQQAIDVEIYKLAQLKGDIRDGARTIAQSDIARLFRTTLPQNEAREKTLLYIQEIEKSISVQARQIQPQQQQQPVIQSKPNQTNEAHYGIIEASRPELSDTADTRGERNRLADREDHAVGSQQYQTNGEDQRASSQQHAPVRENHPDGIESDAEPKRIESQFHELLAAIGGYLELQEIEQLGADIARINQSLTTGRLPGRGATQFTRAVERQDSTNVDSAASYGSIEQQRIADRAASRECLNALANYVEAVSIESSPLAQSLQTLVTNLNRYQHPDLAGAMQELETAISNQIKQPENSIEHTQTQAQTIDAIAQYLEHKFVEAPLVQNLQSLIQKLTALETQVSQQVIEAIANHIEVDSVEANITQTLESLTKRISQLPDHKFTALLQKLANLADKQAGAEKTPINSQQSRFDLENPCLHAIADFVEREAVASSTIVSALSGLKTQLGAPENKQPLEHIDTALSSYLQQLKATIENRQGIHAKQAVEAVLDFVEQSAIESGINPQSLQALTAQISQIQLGELTKQVPQLEAIVSNYQTHLQALAQKEAARSSIEALSNYCDTAAIDSAIAPTIEPLRQQLAALGNSPLSEQLQQREGAIEQHKPLESLKALANQMREIPLPDVATRLGLELDRHDKHKWRGEGQIISINNQKFYDHTCQKGGYGAIDLVMHVQRQNFKQAVDWLSNGASFVPPIRARSQQSKALPEERKPFTQPIADESKWLAVRQYLTEKRQLPPALVDELHHQGRVYADASQNAVFIRKSIEGDITGASLRGTYKDNQFKGLATGSRRDGGWFAFSSGSGKLERIVLTESPIDAMSAAALARQKTGITLFISNDGAGSIPADFLLQQLTKGKQVLVAYDADTAGEEMARKVIAALPGATRVKPSFGKDWNERLVMDKEALETAQALRQLFKRLPSDVRINHPDGCLTFDTPSWQLAQHRNAVSS